MIPSLCLRLAAVLGTLALATATAGAQPDDEDRGDSYLTVTFMGSMLEPLGEMATARDTALASGLRIGWNGRSGLGVSFDALYTPFPHTPGPVEEIEAHFFHGTAAMSYAYRSGVWRLWAAAGGAGVFERVNTIERMQTSRTEHLWSAGGYGAGGIDFLLFANGGLSLSASYTRALFGDELGFYAGSAGVSFLF